LILITSSVLSPAYGELIHIFDDPTPTNQDGFGFSVSVDGNNVLVGAHIDSTNGAFIGQAHLFDATTGNLLRTFDDPTPTVRDEFGTSVAIQGNNVLVGAPLDDTNAPGVGQAYLFDATTGALLQTFDDPTPTQDASFIKGDRFGFSVAIDGNLVLVGAPFDDTNGPNVGQAHLFDATTGALLQTFDDPTPTPSVNLGDLFGSSVAIDGNLVLVGARLDDTNGIAIGQAYLFDATTGALLRTFDDPTVTEFDLFGTSVSIDGNLVLVGAEQDKTNGLRVGQAHLFDATTGALCKTFDDPTVTTTDLFGFSVSISGNLVLVGARQDSTLGTNVGQAYLFKGICNGDEEDGGTAVGGEIIPIQTTSLLLANAQSFSWMIPLVLSGIGIGLFAVSRKSENS